MKQLFSILILSLCHFNTNAQTQQEMNIAAQKEYKVAENEINKIYKEIVEKYKSDTLFIKNLKASERIWIQFRDAEVKMKFPSNEPFVEYGSMYPLCYYGYMELLTRERIKKLSEWLSKSNQEDGCMGSKMISLNLK